MAPISPVTRRALRSLDAAVLLATFAALALAGGQEFVTVKRVIHGDTIMLESGERVRLIGVDTPESVRPKTPVEHFGKEASAFTRRMVSICHSFFFHGTSSDRMVKRGSYPSSGSILTAAACRTKPGGRPCLERISNQPSRESTTLIFIPGLMLAISREVSLG